MIMSEPADASGKSGRGGVGVWGRHSGLGLGCAGPLQPLLCPDPGATQRPHRPKPWTTASVRHETWSSISLGVIFRLGISGTANFCRSAAA